MKFITDLLKTKTAGFYVAIASFVFGLISLITYTARGGNYLSPVSVAAVLLMAFALLTNLLVLYKDFKVLAFVPMMLYASSLAVLMNTEMLFITNVGFGVDGNSFDAAFFVFLITDVLAVLTSAVAFAMGLSKDKKEESEKPAEE